MRYILLLKIKCEKCEKLSDAYINIKIVIIVGKANGKLQGIYLSDGIDKVLYTDGRGIGIRSDYNGVLLLDTILQTPVSKSEDIVKLELLLSEATILLQCLQCVELPGVEHLLEVLQELSSKIVTAQANQKKGIKAQKVNTCTVYKIDYLYYYFIMLGISWNYCSYFKS